MSLDAVFHLSVEFPRFSRPYAAMAAKMDVPVPVSNSGASSAMRIRLCAKQAKETMVPITINGEPCEISLWSLTTLKAIAYDRGVSHDQVFAEMIRAGLDMSDEELGAAIREEEARESSGAVH